MCQVYAKTDPILYESRSRSIRIHGVITGIRLENLFWQILSSMAESEGMTTNHLIVKLHEEVGEHRGEVNNFTSFLRVTCLRYQSLRAESAVSATLAADLRPAKLQPDDPRSGHLRSDHLRAGDSSLAIPAGRTAAKARASGSHPVPHLVSTQLRQTLGAGEQPSTLQDR